MCRRSLQVAMKLIACVIIVGGVIGFFHAGTDRWVCGAIALGGIWFLFLQPIEAQFWTRYRFAKRPDCNKEIEWHFDDELISVITDSSNSQFRWDVFAKCVQSSKGLLFYPNEQQYHWLPVRAFENRGDFDHVSEMARSAIKKFYYVA